MREFDYNGLRLCEYQGKLFEESVSYFKCSTAIFLRRFYHSSLLGKLDKNDSSLLSLDVIEGLNDIEDEFGPSKYGKEKASKDAMFWIGYFYRYISYTRNVRTQFVMKTFSYKQLLSVYYVYHTQDMEWCISNLLKMNNLDENYFDPNWRFKQMLYKEYIKTKTLKSKNNNTIFLN